MDFLQLAKQRYSVRKYTNAKVETEKLNLILEAGRVAPTGVNSQHQHIIVVQENVGLQKIAKAANIYGAPLALIVCADNAKAWQRPFDGKKITDIDAAIITVHLMLQATALGLGTVWICYFKPDVIKAEFGLPANLEAINILAIGYADGSPASPDRHSTARKPLSETVSYEHF